MNNNKLLPNRWFMKEIIAVLFTWSISIVILILSPTNTSRSIQITNSSYAFPLKQDTISDGLLAVFAILIPILSILVTERLFTKSLVSGSIHILGVLMSTAQVELVTDVLKSVVGSPRPDFIARCLPDIPITSSSLLISEFICTGPPNLVRDGYKSFPSGHASLISAGMLYLTMYWHARFNSPSQKLVSVGFSILITHLPILIALLISATRITDNRHSVLDVCAGILIGGVGTLFTFPKYRAIIDDLGQHSAGDFGGSVSF